MLHTLKNRPCHFSICKLLKHLVDDVSRCEVWQYQDVCRSCKFHERIFFLNIGIQCCIGLHWPIDNKRWIENSSHLNSLFNTITALCSRTSKVRKGQHSNLRVDTETSGNLCSLYSNFSECSTIWIDVDRCICKEQNFAFDGHHVATDETMCIISSSNRLQNRAKDITVVPAYTANKAISITRFNHLTGEIWATLEQAFSIHLRNALALPSLEQCLTVCALSTFIETWIVTFVIKIKMHLFHHTSNSVNWSQQNWFADFLLDQLRSGSYDFFIITFGEDNSLVPPSNLIDDATHNRIGHTQSRFQIFPIGLE